MSVAKTQSRRMRPIAALILLVCVSCAEARPVPDVVVKNVAAVVDRAERLAEQVQPLVEACQASPATRGCPEFLRGYDSTEHAIMVAKQAIVLGKSAGELALAIQSLVDQVRELSRSVSQIAPESDADAGPSSGP